MKKMPDLLVMILEFLKTGLFAVGGGYATLPFLHDMAVKYDWFTLSDLTNFIAISEVTPGPVGINMATFAGYLSNGIFGGVLASLAIVTPPTILILILCHFVPNITENRIMKKIFYGLIPSATALILGVFLWLFQNALLSFGDIKMTVIGLVLLAGLTFIAFRWKLSPFLLLLIGGICGFLLL